MHANSHFCLIWITHFDDFNHYYENDGTMMLISIPTVFYFARNIILVFTILHLVSLEGNVGNNEDH